MYFGTPPMPFGFGIGSSFCREPRGPPGIGPMI
jgi:hypothetical protein